MSSSYPIITPKTLDDLVTAFVQAVAGEAKVTPNTQEGSVPLALARASALNDLYIQSMVAQVALNSRIDTATGADLDNLVNQYVPPFTGRIQAIAASSAPLAPTSLQAAAIVGYIYVGVTNGLLVGQALTISNGTKYATCTITGVVPTTTLGVAVANGATSLTVGSTTGMFTGQTLTLVDGSYTVTVTITSIVNGTTLNITALNGAVNHTYATSTTSVLLNNVVTVGAFTYGGGGALSDLVTGSQVLATTMLRGVRFYRNNAAATTPTIPVGTIIQDKLGTVQFTVQADTTNPYFNNGTQLYTVPANQVSINVKVTCTTPGTGGNVAASTLTLLPTAVSGLDGAVNDYAITTGSDTEQDTDLRTRFRAFIQTNASATKAAVGAAISGVQSGLQYNIIENVAADGITAQLGNFVVVASDSQGNLSTTLYNSLKTAIETARPLCSTFTLTPPTVVAPTIVVVLSIDPAYTATAGTVRTAVQTAIFNSFTSTTSGATLVFAKMIELAMDTAGVIDVMKLTINGNGYDKTSGSYVTVGTGPTNLVAAPLQLLRPPLSAITVS